MYFRHLIGFFIFLALTIYTATKVPSVDLQSLQHLPDMLRNADLHKIQAELAACLPSLPHFSDLQKMTDELRSSWNSIDVLPSVSRWRLLELLSSCLPHRFTHSNETNLSVLVSSQKLIFSFHSHQSLLLMGLRNAVVTCLQNLIEICNQFWTVKSKSFNLLVYSSYAQCHRLCLLSVF